MKKSFEEEIKNRLKDMEMPYDASAWKNVNDTLNKTQRNSSSKNLKWLLFSISLITIVSASLYLYQGNNINNSEEKNTKLTAPSKGKNSRELVIHESKNIQSKIKKTDSPHKPTQEKVLTKDNTNVEEDTMQASSVKISNKLLYRENIPVTTTTNKETLSKDTNLANNSFLPLIIPDICLGETVKVENQNNTSIYLTQPNGVKIEFKSDTKNEYTPIISGKYKIIRIENNSILELSTFNVYSIEEVQIELEEENIYKNGLPHRLLSTNASSDNLIWFLNEEEISSNSKSIEISLFSKGNYSIKLVSKNEHCSTSSSKRIEVEKDYNLLAVDAFSPLENNDKTNTFIPYALKERNVSFNFIIIDPKDGYVVYQTSDKLKPWNGIDQRTGQIVPKNSNWIWKVTIDKPQKGENPNYKGIIVRI